MSSTDGFAVSGITFAQGYGAESFRLEAIAAGRSDRSVVGKGYTTDEMPRLLDTARDVFEVDATLDA